MLTRFQQVASLQRSVPSAVSRAQDNHLFDVGLRLSDGKLLTLRIELGADFPQTAPVLRITDPGVAHEWLDSSGRVAGLDMLYRWDARTSNLGTVVQYALSQFCIKPPHVVAGSFHNTVPSPPPRPLSSPSTAKTAKSSTNNNQLEPVQIPSEFLELDNLSPAQLEELMTSESAFTAFFDRLSVVSTLSALKQSIQSENSAKAMKNVSKAQQLEDAEKRMRALNDELGQERTKYTQMVQKEEGLRANPRHFADQLEHLARQADDESESLDWSSTAEGRAMSPAV
ncbi:hypothetical protein BASA81_004729 [Batrachochytrium salamandrivorans]|nr:hypothetical protein BASA81_004729 [Batrachochytrium salamandrivorans]